MENITANIGTPKNIPAGPNIAPPTIIAKIIPIGFTPIESPKILGPKIFPSNCCKSKIKIYFHLTYFP